MKGRESRARKEWGGGAGWGGGGQAGGSTGLLEHGALGAGSQEFLDPNSPGLRERWGDQAHWRAHPRKSPTPPETPVWKWVPWTRALVHGWHNARPELTSELPAETPLGGGTEVQPRGGGTDG